MGELVVFDQKAKTTNKKLVDTHVIRIFSP